MAYGLSVQGGAGFVQIDSELKNYQVRASGSMVLSGHVNGAYGHNLPSYNPATEKLFVRSPNTDVFLATIWNGKIAGLRATASSASFTLNYIILSRNPPTAVSGNWGLEVYTSAGALAYVSNNQASTIVGVYTDMPTDLSSTNSFNLPAATGFDRYFELSAGSSIHGLVQQNYPGNFTYRLFAYGVKVNNSTVSTRIFQTWADIGWPTGFQGWRGYGTRTIIVGENRSV